MGRIRWPAPVLALLLGACAAPSHQTDALSRIERRLDTLERRLDGMERKVSSAQSFPARPPPGIHDPSDLERLETLRLERDELLLKYRPGHPDVLEAERAIRRLESGLRERDEPLQNLGPEPGP